MLEIELKFSVADRNELADRLVALGAVAGETVNQADAYFNHPQRDFAVTDEALRIRTVGEESFVTYKGPRQPGAVKTRFELELPLAPQSAEGWGELLTKLGFQEVATVRKRRTLYAVEHNDWQLEVVLDEVAGLGHFVEVETLADVARQQEGEEAVANLATQLGLLQPEPRSYLEMLLDS